MMTFKKFLPKIVEVTKKDHLIRGLQYSDIQNVTLCAIPDPSDAPDVQKTMKRLERMIKNHTNYKTDLFLVSIVRDEEVVF